jgi:Protein of unknown function (DUF2971)
MESALREKIGEQPRNRFYRRLWNDRYHLLGVAGEVFVASFSENPDLLSQWRAYTGGGAGFSIGFQTENILSRAVKQHFRLVKCIYDPSIQKRIIKKLLASVCAHYVRTREFTLVSLRCALLMAGVAAVLKHPSFAEEREWRIVSDYMYGHPFDNKIATKWRPGHSTLIPYTEFLLSGNKRRASLFLVSTLLPRLTERFQWIPSIAFFDAKPWVNEG